MPAHMDAHLGHSTSCYAVLEAYYITEDDDDDPWLEDSLELARERVSWDPAAVCSAVWVELSSPQTVCIRSDITSYMDCGV